MQFLLEFIRKIVVLVLLMELVIQMQPGKAYEPYIKMLVGIMVVYSIVSGIGHVFTNITSFQMAPMQEYVWSDDRGGSFEAANESETEDSDISIKVPDLEEVRIKQITVEEIKVKEMK